MLFSYTAFLVVAVALLFGAVSAAPVPPDQPGVHNNAPLPPAGPLPIVAPKKRYNSEVIRENDAAIAACKKANTDWGYAKNINKKLAEQQIAWNNHFIEVYQQTKTCFDKKENDHEANAIAYDSAVASRIAAQNSGEAAMKVLDDHERAAKKAKEKEREAARKARQEAKEDRRKAKEAKRKARENSGKSGKK